MTIPKKEQRSLEIFFEEEEEEKSKEDGKGEGKGEEGYTDNAQ